MATTEPKELNCLQRAFDGPTGKRWTMVPCLSDHIFILRSDQRARERALLFV